MSIGHGFGSWQPRQVINRIPRSPLDKCTIVSIYPDVIRENKTTVFPGSFEIPAAKDNDFSLLTVEGGSWFKEQLDNMPILEIPIDSFRIAESVIKDYCSGMLEYTPGVAGPGLFFLGGEYDKQSIQKAVSHENIPFSVLMEKAKAIQREWFIRLVALADKDWVLLGGNPAAITKLSRMAAEKLNLAGKPWMMDTTMIQKQNCPACGSLINPGFPICSNCKHIVDKSAAEKIGYKVA